MRRSLTISGIAHAVVLGWGLVAFAARPNDAPPTEPLPVEFISATDFSQLTERREECAESSSTKQSRWPTRSAR